MTVVAALLSRIALASVALVQVPAAGDGAGPLLEVRSARDGARVANAAVRFVDMSSVATNLPFENDLAVTGVLQRAEATGAHLTTSSDGRVRLPWFHAAALLLVRADGAGGAGDVALLQLVAPCDPHLLILLQPARELVVAVNDVHGAPRADVELRLFRRDYGRFELLWSGTAGARITLPRFDTESDESPRTPPLFVIAACIGLPTSERTPEWMAPLRDETTRVELRLPAFGALNVVVKETEATPSRTMVAAFAAPPGMGKLTNELVGSILTDPSVVFAEVKQGRAALPCVACGQSVALIGISPTRQPVVRVVAGPTKEGEELEVALDLSAAMPLPLVRGVAAGLDAAPLAKRDLELEIATTPAMGDEPLTPIRTDASGAFSVVDPRVASVRHAPFAPYARLLARGASARDLLASAPIPLPAPDAEGVCTLGPLLLVPPPIWIEGRVVDADGRPLDAEVSVKLRDDDEIGDKPSFARHRSWFAQFPPPASRPYPGGSFVRSGRDGRFALFGNPASNAAEIRVTRVGYLRSERTVTQADPTAGSSPYVTLEDVVLERLATVHGRIEVERGVPPSLFEIAASGSALRHDNAARQAARIRRSVDRDGAFTLTGLGAGELRWSLYVTGESKPVRSGTLTIAPPTRDDAHLFLPPIALAGAVPLIHVKVVPAEPAPDLDASLSYRRSATDHWATALGSLSDGFVVPKTAENFEAVVFVANHRMVRIADLSADREVAVPAGIPFRLAVAFEADLPKQSHVRLALKPLLGFSETSDEEAPWNGEVSEVVPGDAPRARFALSRDSAWHVSVAIYPAGFGFPAEVKLTESHIEVADTDAEQELTLHVTAEQIDEALARR